MPLSFRDASCKALDLRRSCSEQRRHRMGAVLGGSGDLVSKVISPLIGVISNYQYSYLVYSPTCGSVCRSFRGSGLLTC